MVRVSLAAAGTAVAVIGTVEAGIMLVLAGKGVTGMAGVSAGMVATVAAGELVPQ